MSKTIRPIGDRLIIQFNEPESMKGGIYIPESSKGKPQEAKVVALGAGKKNERGALTPFEVKVGDTVVVGRYAGTEVRTGDKTYVIVTEDDILGVVS